jgi:hypothetical protein
VIDSSLKCNELSENVANASGKSLISDQSLYPDIGPTFPSSEFGMTYASIGPGYEHSEIGPSLPNEVTTDHSVNSNVYYHPSEYQVQNENSSTDKSEPLIAATLPNSFNIDVEALMKRRMLTVDSEVGPTFPPPSSVSLPDEYLLEKEPSNKSASVSSSITSYNPSSITAVNVGNNSSLGVSVAPGPAPSARIQGPKIIKPDAELTSFVPAALRIKRNQSGALINNIQANKVQKLLNVQEKSSAYGPAAASSTNIDDAYSSFMNEISEITG